VASFLGHRVQFASVYICDITTLRLHCGNIHGGPKLSFYRIISKSYFMVLKLANINIRFF